MKRQEKRAEKAIVGLVFGLTLGVPFEALAELVYEGAPVTSGSLEGAPAGEESVPRRTLEREALRKSVRVAENAHATQKTLAQTQTVTEAMPTPAAPVVVQTLPAPVTPAIVQASTPQPEVSMASRSELQRRERTRIEIQNEDILQQRLEELRLEEEKKRTESLLSGGLFAPQASKGQGLTQRAAPLREEVLSDQVEALPPIAPVPSKPMQPTAVAPAPSASTSMSSAPVVAYGGDAEEKPAILSIAPRAGLSTMSSVTGFSIQSRYTAGLAFGVGVTENLGFELGYSYSEFGVALASTNPWVLNYQAWTGAREAIALKQNVIDAGLKLHFLGPEARLRPFITAGGAYGKSFINYDDRIIGALAQSGFSSLANDYEVSSFLGYIGTGLDLRLSKSVSIGAQFKYFTVLSARENQSLNQAALGGFVPGGLGYGYPVAPAYGGVYGADLDKQVLGGTLARASFYSITAGVSFSF
jgi:outer membrane protein W